MLGESVCGDVGLMGGAQLGTRQGREERRAGKGKGARMARPGVREVLKKLGGAAT